MGVTSMFRPGRNRTGRLSWMGFCLGIWMGCSAWAFRWGSADWHLVPALDFGMPDALSGLELSYLQTEHMGGHVMLLNHMINSCYSCDC